VHMIEEYARHNGHADLIRELIDPGGRLVGATATGRRLPVRDLSRRPRARQATTAGTSNAATRAAVLPPYCLEVPGLSIIARCPAGSSYVHSDTQV